MYKVEAVKLDKNGLERVYEIETCYGERTLANHVMYFERVYPDCWVRVTLLKHDFKGTK
jgi:hypothetical protein